MDRVVALGVLIRGDRVLLVKRAASRALSPGMWDFPGGHSETGEAPANAMVRELAEEIGVVPVSYSEYKETPARSLNSEGLPVHCYFVTDWTGTPRNLQKHEHSEIAWIRLAEAEKLELASPRMLSLLEAIDIAD